MVGLVGVVTGSRLLALVESADAVGDGDVGMLGVGAVVVRGFVQGEAEALVHAVQLVQLALALVVSVLVLARVSGRAFDLVFGEGDWAGDLPLFRFVLRLSLAPIRGIVHMLAFVHFRVE